MTLVYLDYALPVQPRDSAARRTRASRPRAVCSPLAAKWNARPTLDCRVTTSQPLARLLSRTGSIQSFKMHENLQKANRIHARNYLMSLRHG